MTAINFETKKTLRNKIADNSNFAQEIINVRDLNVCYGENLVLKNVNIDIPKNKITAFIGPSGCGKTTLLRCFNRMNDLIKSFKKTGDIFLDGQDIYDEKQNIIELRKKVGMIFQQPNPLPMTIYNNLKLPLREHDKKIANSEIKRIINEKLVDAHLFDEVGSRLNESALKLSGGQQQRLCIARALAIMPEVILFDEPCSALDPISTMKIEDLLFNLKENYTIIIVTHNLEQAARIADKVAFFYEGEIVEQGNSEEFFTNPKTELAQRYLQGRF